MNDISNQHPIDEPSHEADAKQDGTPVSLAKPSDAAQTAIEQTPQIWRFKFSGDALEYFKIWIVNWLLIIVTLGFYAPWAKVRRLRYFYGNTMLNERAFDFVANPKRIFIGRLIAIGIYFIISIISNISPEVAAIGFFIIFALVPWMLRSTLRFRARNSKYGNNRFTFTGSLGAAYGMMIGGFLLGLFSFGLLLPIAWRWFKRYQFNHTQFGHLKLSFNATIGDVYKAALLPFGIAFVLFAATGVLFMMAAALNDAGADIIGSFAALLAGLVYFVVYLAIFPLFQGFFTKLTWEKTTLGTNQFATTINPFRFAFIGATNYLALIPSLGLLWAWGQIRITRYQLENISLIVHDFPDELTDLADADASPLGEELSDVFDLDISW